MQCDFICRQAPKGECMGTQDGVKLACQPCATCLKKLDAEERKKEKLKEDVQDDDAEAIEDDEQEEDGKKMPRSTADAGKTQARSAMKQALQFLMRLQCLV